MAAIYQKLLSGLLNWQDAERLIRDTVAAAGRDWPLNTAKPVGDQMKALIVNLVAEACAEVQRQPLDVRVLLAGLVSQCYAILGETARARIALARASDLAAKLPRDASATAALQATEAEILRAEGVATTLRAFTRSPRSRKETTPLRVWNGPEFFRMRASSCAPLDASEMQSKRSETGCLCYGGSSGTIRTMSVTRSAVPWPTWLWFMATAHKIWRRSRRSR